MMGALKESVEALGFNVDFDGIELRKPFLLPSAFFAKEHHELSPEEYHVDTFSYDDEMAGERLAFKGYQFNQRYSMAPSEISGVAVRIKNTAIGGIRAGFLDYPAPEKLFFQQSMGEIYVDEGLEDAMNVDRATFRVGHPHYSFLQAYLHRRLAILFRESRGWYVRRRKADELALQAVVLSQLEELFGSPFALRSVGRRAPDPVELDIADGIATIFRAHDVYKG